MEQGIEPTPGECYGEQCQAQTSGTAKAEERQPSEHGVATRTALSLVPRRARSWRCACQVSAPATANGDRRRAERLPTELATSVVNAHVELSPRSPSKTARISSAVTG